MRVLHVDSAREWRGGQTQLLHLARAMPECAVALPADALLRPALEGEGIRVLPVDFRGALRGTRALREAIRAFDPDLVAAQTSHAHGHALLASGRPLVVHRRLDFRPSWISRRKYRAADRFVAVSGAVREVLVGIGVAADRIDVVLDGVDRGPIDAATPEPTALRFELGLPSDARLCLAVGALVPHKGHEVLVRALALLPDWHGLIAGEGPLRGPLSRQAERLGVASRLFLLGERTDVPRLHKSVDVVVHPSLQEGMGQAAAEALIAGARVVGSDTGGLREVLDGLGLLVAPGDPAALAEGIRVGSCLIPEDLRRLRGRFALDAMVHGTLDAYRRALSPG